MTPIFIVNCVNVTKTKKGNLRYKWYETPMYFKLEEAMKHAEWFTNIHKNYMISHVSQRTIF